MAVHVRIDPQEAERTLRTRGAHAAPGAHRAGVVAADHHGKVTVPHTLAHELGETPIELNDGREHIGARIRAVFAARVARPLAGGDANDDFVSHVSSSSTPTEYRRPFALSSPPDDMDWLHHRRVLTARSPRAATRSIALCSAETTDDTMHIGIERWRPH